MTTKRFRIKPKPVKRIRPPRVNQVLMVDTVTNPLTHDPRHNYKLMGPATLAIFKGLVTASFNKTSNDGKSRMIYLARMRPGKKPERIAKLFTAKRDKRGWSYKMFSTFYAPDGKEWQRRANISRIFEKAKQDYPSREFN